MSESITQLLLSIWLDFYFIKETTWYVPEVSFKNWKNNKYRLAVLLTMSLCSFISVVMTIINLWRFIMSL